MPTYSYACKNCGHAFDIAQAFTDDALTVCPNCEGQLRKVWGSVGVVFKGSGFYRNDSRDADKKKTSSAVSTASASSSDGAGSTSGDSAAAKSDSKGTGSTSSDPKSSGSTTSSGTKDSSSTSTSAGSSSSGTVKSSS